MQRPRRSSLPRRPAPRAALKQFALAVQERRHRPLPRRPAPAAALRDFARAVQEHRRPLPHRPAPRAALRHFAARRLPPRFIPRPPALPLVGMAVLDVHDRPAGAVGALAPNFIRIDTPNDSFWLETSMVHCVDGGQVALLCSKRHLKDHSWE
jgi:hypothetical protein